MQAFAIFEAAANVIKSGTHCHPHIMVPLVGIADELECQVKVLKRVALKVQETSGVKIPHALGTMIEVPRGALQVGRRNLEAPQPC